MKNLETLFGHTLNDVSTPEEKLINALLKMAKNSQNKKLAQFLEDYRRETTKHRKNLKEVYCKLDIQARY